MTRSNSDSDNGSTFGPELLVVLDRSGGTRAGLERALREAIREGRLIRGTRLPSSRVLARDLTVSRGTVVGAYNQLIAEGFLTAVRGSGTVVAGTAVAGVSPGTRATARPDVTTAPRPALRPGGRSREPATRDGGSETMHGPAPLSTRPPFPFDLRPGRPDLSAFPRGPWLAASKRVWATAPREALDYGNRFGDPGLRSQLAAYLGRVRGVRADPDQLVVCGGYIEGLALVAGALGDLGARTVAMEDPCLPLHRRIVSRAGLEVVGMPVDAEGAMIDGLADGPPTGRPIGVVVTPAHQHPLGAALSPARRSALVSLARERDAIVVEDDYDGEFRYDREPVGALQGLAPDRVVYAGTASKTLAPALRLGWLVLPDVLLEPVG
ncbi:MAG: PLP-dependent aminotransferase family protein, partial [Frankia sp.]